MKNINREKHYWYTYLRNRRDYEREHGKRVPLRRMLRWYLPWRMSLRPGRSPTADRLPWVAFGAKERISEVISKGSKVFEYGMGGSTLFFLDAGCAVTSVEHDVKWGEKLSKFAATSGQWTALVYPPSSMYETMINSHYSSQFPGYENSNFRDYVETIASQPDESLDLVMVDGRARSAALVAAAAKVVPGGVIVLDNSERPRYKTTLKQLISNGWTSTSIYGPGPYVDFVFWETTFLVKSQA